MAPDAGPRWRPSPGNPVQGRRKNTSSAEAASGDAEKIPKRQADGRRREKLKRRVWRPRRAAAVVSMGVQRARTSEVKPTFSLFCMALRNPSDLKNAPAKKAKRSARQGTVEVKRDVPDRRAPESSQAKTHRSEGRQNEGH